MATTIKHPRSGDLYAVDTDASGRVIRACGPLKQDHEYESDELSDILGNQDWPTLDETAYWLQAELDGESPQGVGTQERATGEGERWSSWR